ncbi:hypothetical protein, partial [Tolypothrix sp. LEGE 11397]
MVILTDFKALSIKDYSHQCRALFLLGRGFKRFLRRYFLQIGTVVLLEAVIFYQNNETRPRVNEKKCGRGVSGQIPLTYLRCHKTKLPMNNHQSILSHINDTL